MERLSQRKRNSNKRRTKSIIVVGCEGKNKTETNYLSNFCSRECIIKFSTGHHTNPIGMVHDLVHFMKEQDIKKEYGDKVYLLIDTDINENKQEQLEQVIKICKENDIELITSTPAFEYWYILHYEYTTKNYGSSKNLKRELKDSWISGYTEHMNVYDILKDKIDIAIKNAKRVETFHIKNGVKIDSEEANPHTSVYKIVEELKRRNELDKK